MPEGDVRSPTYHSLPNETIGRTPPGSPKKRRSKSASQSPKSDKRSPCVSPNLNHCDYYTNTCNLIDELASTYGIQGDTYDELGYSVISTNPELPPKSSYSFRPDYKPRRASDSQILINELESDTKIRIESSTPPLMSGSETDEVYSASEFSVGCQYMDPHMGYDSGPEIASGLDDPPLTPESNSRRRKVSCEKLIFSTKQKDDLMVRASGAGDTSPIINILFHSD